MSYYREWETTPFRVKRWNPARGGKGDSGKRKDSDGSFYTKKEFKDQYGGYGGWWGGGGAAARAATTAITAGTINHRRQPPPP